MTAYNGQYEYEMIINLQPDFVSNRREVEVDMEKCKKRNTEHCTKSKFCAIRDRSKIIEPLSESYPQAIATTSL